MGVTSLWEVLKPALVKTVPLKDLRGHILAVDLSSWILKLSLQSNIKNNKNVFVRNLFHRITAFMQAGVNLVFVLDGRAPHIKQKVLRNRQSTSGSSHQSYINLDRRGFVPTVNKCLELLECLGLPHIQAEGEAEALCAALNKIKLVDGCITEDGDVFCYGADTVYRNLEKDRKSYKMDKFTMNHLKDKLSLDRNSLIAFALLAGSDYGPGIKNIGKEKALKVIVEIQSQGHCPLNRLFGWRNNQELDSIEKSSHCKKCEHEGTTTLHKSQGCKACGNDKSCDTSSSRPCFCQWHLHRYEIHTRHKAMECHDFPNEEIKTEFLQEDLAMKVTIADLKPEEPELPALIKYMKNVRLSEEKIKDKIAEVLIHQSLQGRQFSSHLTFSPERIIRECKEEQAACYEVEYKRPDGFRSGGKETIQVRIQKEMFMMKYPRLHQQFLEQTPTKRKSTQVKTGVKRKLVKDPGQRGVDEIFHVKKRLFNDTKSIDLTECAEGSQYMYTEID